MSELSEPERFPRMLTLEEVQDVLNLRKPLVSALVKSGELRAAQFGGSEGSSTDSCDRAYDGSRDHRALRMVW
jgi:hypothetical protein